MAYYEPGAESLRAEFIDRIIKGVALRTYELKGLLMTPTSKSWEETYYTESTKNLNTGSDIARLAEFPASALEWEKNTAYQSKHGTEAVVSWEDALSNNVDVIQRTIKRVASDIARSVDSTIWTTLTGATGINTLTISAGEEWDHSTRANRIPHEHIGRARAAIADGENTNYKPDTVIVNHNDYTYLITNDYVMDSFDASTPALMKNGNMGTLMGLKLIVTQSCATDKAMVLASKICGTYRQLQGLKTATIPEQGISHTIRAWEIGVPFVTDPEAITYISNTNA
jgi:hypothetical protein